MVLNLWTVRLLVEAMGVDGYGAWSLVVSVVLVWSFLCDIVGDAIMRYVSVALGRGDGEKRLSSIFKVFTRLYISADLIMVIMASTIGYLWLAYEADIATEDKTVVMQTFFIVIAMQMVKALNVPFCHILLPRRNFANMSCCRLPKGLAPLVQHGC